MKKLLLILILFSIIPSFSQCKKGNCNDGNGTYDFGWCVYNGEFKNSKPEGKGTMKYDDYSYTGNFKNGLEDGEGIITNKNGSIEKVKYEKGIKDEGYHLEKIVAKDYKPLESHDANCIDGNCVNGFGTYKYQSGNKYVGNWINSKFDGNGIFYFADGERFEGIFKNNQKASGTYFYKIGAKYTGTYDEKGFELNGTISAVTGVSIPYVNGKPILPPKPEIAKEEKQGNDGKGRGILTFCRTCNGTGSVTDRVVTNTYSETTHYKSCPKCNGAGRWME